MLHIHVLHTLVLMACSASHFTVIVSARSALTSLTFNLLFLLSAGGKLNYMGTKRWIEDQLDSSGKLSPCLGRGDSCPGLKV